MDILKDDFNRELNRINDKIQNNSKLDEEDVKIILLSELSEEDLHESKQ